MPGTADRTSAGHKILGYLALFFVLGIVLIPYTYVGLSAFKSPMEMFDVKWFPDEWSLEAWKYVIFDLKFQNYLFNSFLAGLGAAVIALIVAVPEAGATQSTEAGPWP